MPIAWNGASTFFTSDISNVNLAATGFTAMVWMAPYWTGSTGTCVCRPWASTEFDQFGLGHSSSATRKVYYSTCNEAGADLKIYYATPLDTWMHVAMTVSTGDNGTLTAYHNGAPVGTTTFGVGHALGDARTAAWVGCGVNPVLGTRGEYLLGYSNDVRVYRRVLAAEEIQTIYYTGGKDGITDGIILRLRMSELANLENCSLSSIEDTSPYKVETDTISSPVPIYQYDPCSPYCRLR
jgi:hypothetical protein